MTRPSARGPRTIAALVSVTAIEDLSPTFRRVRLAGPDLLEASPGLIGDGPEITCSDAYLKLVIPPPGGEPQRPDLEAGLPAWFALPVEQRGWLRTYTARSCRWIDHDGRRVPEIAVDVALHAADEGPGGRWFATAGVGSSAFLLVPGADEPIWASWAPGQAERVVAVGDETAAPALLSIAEQLQAQRPGRPADVIIEVPDDADAEAYPPARLPRERPRRDAGLRLHVLARGRDEDRGRLAATRLAETLGVPAGAVDEVMAGRRPSSLAGVATGPDRPTGAADPAGSADPAADDTDTGLLWTLADSAGRGGTYVFLAGEASSVKAWRRLAVEAAGCPKDAVTFMGYWRRGRAES
ncbi:siderophore-interacting protein [Kocuria palustris]|uniref:siderophore-interacting protein n=1 Tax=Kocuria palustris TaxID=71999 RepID=UPI0011A3C4FA|nr:siderophore-interacting protein [Kocuria palustris]